VQRGKILVIRLLLKENAATPRHGLARHASGTPKKDDGNMTDKLALFAAWSKRGHMHTNS
jgi:hypothetical protein